MKRKLIGLCLVFALFLNIAVFAVSAPIVKAAKTTKQSISLYVGERVPVTIEKGVIKKIKSSNKTVAKTKKESAKGFYIIAKGVGTSTVNVKTSKGKHVFYVTVREVQLQVSQESLYVKRSYMGTQYNSTVTFKIVNKTATHISSATVKHSLTDTEGKVVENGSFIVNCLPPESAAYHSVDYAMKETAVASSEPEIDSWIRDPGHEFVDQSANYEVKQDTENPGDYIITNNGSAEAAGNADIMFRDTEGAVTYMESASFYLKPGDSSKYTLSFVPEGKAEIVIRAASVKS